MKNFYKRIIAGISAISILAVSALSVWGAAWIDPQTDIRSPLSASEVSVNVTDVATCFGGVCYDLQSVYPTSLYELKANGVKRYALCVAAQHNTPGNSGKAYRIDLSGLAGCSGADSHLLEASANLTANDGTYTVWEEAFRCSDLSQYNDEEIMRKIAWMIDDGHWTYYPLARTYSADEGNYGVELDFDHPINSTGIYRDLVISSDALNRYSAISVPASRIGSNISGLYGTAHAIASRIISGERYHLSGTIYYSYTRTDSDKATYDCGTHSAFAYGDDGNGNNNYVFRKMQIMQYFNIIAHAPVYDGELYLYSPDRRSGDGQQWLLYVDRGSDYIGQKAYVRPAIDKDSTSGCAMTGAEFSLFSDEMCSESIGVLRDTDGNGVYSDYSNLINGEDERPDLIHLMNNNNGHHTFSCYLKETAAPTDFISLSGKQVPLADDLTDDKVYKVEFDYLYSTGKLEITVSDSNGQVYSGSVSGYDGISDPGNAYIGNNQSGNFVEGSGLSLIKLSDNGYDVTGTVFELYRGTDTDSSPLGYCKYSDGWNWYSDKSGTDLVGSSYPIANDSQYTVVEEYTVDHYEDTEIPYTVRNVSGWTKIGLNRYSYTFDSSGMKAGEVITIAAVNDRETASVKICKSSDDGIIAGRRFEIVYLGSEAGSLNDVGISAAEVCTGDDGIAVVDNLPLGWYTIDEADNEDYVLEWQQGTMLRDGKALVHLTASGPDEVMVSAINHVSAKIAVLKRDSWTGQSVPGAEFRLYRDDNGNNVIDDGETESFIEGSDDDNDGIVVFDNVGIGDYNIVEYSAPIGYYKNEDIKNVSIAGLPAETVSVGGKDVTAFVITVDDEPYKAPVYVYKRDSRDDGSSLSGASFEIYEDTNHSGSYEEGIDQNACIISDGIRYRVFMAERNGRYETVADIGGIVSAELRYGTYFIVETVAPEMYVRTQEIMTVIISRVNTDNINRAVPIEVEFINDMDFGTLLTGINDTKTVELSTEAHLTDRVTYTNLIAGRSYSLKGELFIRDSEGNPSRTGITGETGFTVEDDGSGIVMPDGTIRVSGTCDVDFVFDSTSLAGCTLVAFETLEYRTRVVATHYDINDVDQTVYIPSVTTELTDGDTNTHTVSRSSNSVLIDTVSYNNVVPGIEYRLTGTLVDKLSGNVITDNDMIPVTSEVFFTPQDSSGTVDVRFELDTSSITSDQIVAFEELTYNGALVAVHEDINDESQTVGIPELVTRASDDHGNKYVGIGENTVIVDSVRYSNLTPGMTYTIEGALVNAGTGELYTDSNNSPAVQTVTFVPDDRDGVVEVPFSINASNLNDGDRLVVFETAYAKPDDRGARILLCEHKDLRNEYQTVTLTKDIPKTGDDSGNGEYVIGLSAGIGVIIALLGIGGVMGRKMGSRDET